MTRSRTKSQSPLPATWLAATLSCAVWSCAGCHRDMHDQPRYEVLEASDFFPDGQSARLPVAGTVARGELNQDEAFSTGKQGGQFVAELPVGVDQALVDRALVERGRERFNIYCAVCHAATGSGDGMIVRRGFRRPPSYHTQRLRDAPAGHFFDVITNGFGAMPRFSDRIEPADRWAIIAYVRVLQLSQNATLDDVPVAQRAALEAAVTQTSDEPPPEAAP
ncbi:MAG: cytochrome c [Pirellulaceae bacterium]